MEIKDLARKMEAFVASQGWYAPDSPKPQTPRNLAISLAIETSEILEHLQWRDQPPDKAQLADELADVALYLIQLATITEIDLEAAILQKLDDNRNRDWDHPS